MNLRAVVKIVKDLLIFSHSEQDKFAKENLLRIIDNGATVISHHFEIHGITLIKEYPKQPVEIYCNAYKIQQAIMSLLINSIEAMPNGGKIIIKVSTEGNYVIIRITDEGIGIAAKDLPHIFEPFYTTKEASTGTGLGLAVVYGIITNHKGKVEVEKTSNQGTTFKVVLPQTKICLKGVLWIERKILIVDDKKLFGNHSITGLKKKIILLILLRMEKLH
jgi:Signal transduction histidine kinase